MTAATRTRLTLNALEAREVPATLTLALQGEYDAIRRALAGIGGTTQVVTTAVATNVNLVAHIPGPPANVATTSIETNVNLVVRPRSPSHPVAVTGRPVDVTQPPSGLQLREPVGTSQPLSKLTGFPIGLYVG